MVSKISQKISIETKSFKQCFRKLFTNGKIKYSLYYKEADNVQGLIDF